MIIEDWHDIGGAVVPEEERQQQLAEITDILRKYEALKESRGEVWCQLWEIHDRDSPRRKRFCSLHFDDSKQIEFHRQYNQTLPEHAPDTYCAFVYDNEHKLIRSYLCRVDARTFKRIKDSDIGLWCVTIPANTTEAIALIPPGDFMSLTEGVMSAR